MKNNHMTNMTHGQIQMVPTHITQRQPAVNLPGIMASQGSSYHPAAAHYPFNPQQASQTVTLMPNVNYPTNQQGMFFTTPTRPLQMTNLPQGPQNPPVANMSNAQNSNGKSLLVQSQSMAMASNAQPMPQVPQQPFQQAYRPLRKKTIIKIIDPNTGREVDLNNSSQGPPTADELAKMKLQTQFQSQVLSAVRKDVIKSSDNNPNYKGEDKVTNEFQSQVKKLSSESVSEPTKAIEIDTQVSEEVISDVEERNVVSTNIKEERIIKTESISIDVGLVVNAEENSSDVKECDVKTPIKIVPSSTTSPEVQIQNTDVINISEDPIISKKNLDKESIKSGMFFTTPTRPLQMTNLPQGPQNPPVANMSNAQNSNGKSLLVQSQSMAMASNAQPMPQVPQQPFQQAYRPLRKKTIIKIIDPNTGREVDLNNSSQGPPTADELAKMKLQTQFQSQVLSAVRKDVIKSSDNNPNYKGEDKVTNEFQSQVKKLSSESVSEPTKAIEIDTQVSEEVISDVEERNVVSTNIKEERIIKTESISIDVGLVVNAEENSSDVKECDVKTPIKIVPSSTTSPEVQIQNTDVINISEDPIISKKNLDKESIKSVKPKKSKIKKENNQQKNLVNSDGNDGINVENSIEPAAIEPVIEPKTDIIKQQENKENENNYHNSKNEEEESVIPKLEELPQQPEEIQNNGVKHEPVENSTPNLPSYLEKLPYAEGQWSITNPTGKKVYSKAFLLQLGSEAICKKKPDVLSNWSNLIKLSGAPQVKSLSQSSVKRNSSKKKTDSKTAKPNTIHMSLSLGEEVKLNQTENAWVPTAAKKATKSEVSKTKNEEEQKNDEVNKNVRSILNKITPDNMLSLTERFKALPIDTIQRLERTIDLVFEKAIEEQSFAPLYASLCSAMQSVQVHSKDGKTASFKKLIISKCQRLFELDKAQEMDSAKKLTEINSCKDPENKKQLQLEFEDSERRLRKRSVGNCRFIGELFKQKILSPSIMLYCIVNLVTKHVEEPLECLCNLLITVGKKLEQSHNLNDTFDKLKALTSSDMKSKIPSRIKFMIQDVIDLRRNKWIPRRAVGKPKFINEIENDVKNEIIEQQSISFGYNKCEKGDHHRGDDKFREGENKSRCGNENEWNDWNVVQTNTKYKQQNYTIGQNKLLGLKDNTSMTTLSPPKRPFSTGKNMTFTSSNPHAVLNNKKSSTSAQIKSNKNTSRKPVISKSEERQRMMSGVVSMMPQLAQPSPSINSSSSQPKELAEELTLMDNSIPDKIYIICKNILLEYEQLQNLDDIIYSLSEDQSSEIRTRHEEFVKSMSLITLDNSPITRTTIAGNIFAELLSKNILSMEAITQGIDAVLKDWNDYLIDYPQFFSYIAAIIAPLLLSQNASFDFNNLKGSCTSIRPDNSSKFFIEVLNKILSSKETQNIKEQLGGILWIYNKWMTSEYVPLDVFMPNNQINNFFKNDRIGVFLLSIAIYDKMKLTDSKLLYDMLHSWISANISAEIIKFPQFVRALTIAIVILCSKPNHSYEDFFDHVHVKLLTFYIRSNTLPEPEIQAREVQCLYGIQIISAALELPGGMVLRLFHKLYQDSVISKESFELWKKDDEFKSGFDEDLETKTMAVVVLNLFFPSLASNDSDEDETVV